MRQTVGSRRLDASAGEADAVAVFCAGDSMHIDHEPKLDFKDVLIRPKRSALPSRAQVDITRKFTFKHSPNRYNGIPIIASNMDTVGTFEMARAFSGFGLSVALHKHYAIG